MCFLSGIAVPTAVKRNVGGVNVGPSRHKDVRVLYTEVIGDSGVFVATPAKSLNSRESCTRVSFCWSNLLCSKNTPRGRHSVSLLVFSGKSWKIRRKSLPQIFKEKPLKSTEGGGKFMKRSIRLAPRHNLDKSLLLILTIWKFGLTSKPPKMV